MAGRGSSPGRPGDSGGRTPAGVSRWGLVLGAAAGTGLVAGAVAGWAARLVVTPPSAVRESLEVLALTEGPDPTVTLLATPETTEPGTYLFSAEGGRSSLRLGEVRGPGLPAGSRPQRPSAPPIRSHHEANLRQAASQKTVTRAVLARTGQPLAPGARGRWIASLEADPRAAGWLCRDVVLELPVGPAPAWVVPAPAAEAAPDGQDSGTTWAVMVHGRGATRRETVRGIAAAQQLGMPSLHLSYRNDGEAPGSADGRYGLGLTEWRDVEAGIGWALEHGAQRVVLFGWSMGGAVALQTADRSRYRDRIAALVLDGPVVDWYGVLRHQARAHRLPWGTAAAAARLLGARRAHRVVGLLDPIDLRELDWLARAEEIRVPVLVLHSLEDEFVPAAAGRELARRSPLVDFVAFRGAQHTHEWNTDPQRWTREVTDWLGPRLAGH